jgi:hypothetical protein
LAPRRTGVNGGNRVLAPDGTMSESELHVLRARLRGGIECFDSLRNTHSVADLAYQWGRYGMAQVM